MLAAVGATLRPGRLAPAGSIRAYAGLGSTLDLDEARSVCRRLVRKGLLREVRGEFGL